MAWNLIYFAILFRESEFLWIETLTSVELRKARRSLLQKTFESIKSSWFFISRDFAARYTLCVINFNRCQANSTPAQEEDQNMWRMFNFNSSNMCINDGSLVFHSRLDLPSQYQRDQASRRIVMNGKVPARKRQALAARKRHKSRRHNKRLRKKRAMRENRPY